MVLITIIASATAWMVAAVGPLLRVAAGMPAGIEGVVGVMVEVETLMHQNHGSWPATLLGLMDRYVLVGWL